MAFQAKLRGLNGVDDLPFELFISLARMWRIAHPVAGT
jgi:hypothetical protein